MRSHSRSLQLQAADSLSMLLFLLLLLLLLLLLSLLTEHFDRLIALSCLQLHDILKIHTTSLPP